MKKLLFTTCLSLSLFAYDANAAIKTTRGHHKGAVKASNFKQMVSKKYNFTDFTALIIGNAFKIKVVQGEDYSVRVSGSKEAVDKVGIELNDNELEVDYNRSLFGIWDDDDNLLIEISMPLLTKIDFSGATVSEIRGFDLKSLIVDLSGASTSRLYLNAKKIDLDISGASSAKLVGKGLEMDCEISGASSLNSLGFKTDIAEVDASGASSAKLYANKSIDASASGASSISYRGEAKVNGDVSLASCIKKLD